MVLKRFSVFDKNKSNVKEESMKKKRTLFPDKSELNSEVSTSYTSTTTEPNRLFQDKLLEMEQRQIKDAMKEHYSASSMGFKQQYRRTLKYPPEWITILNEAGISEDEIIYNIRNDDILEFFNNEEIVYKLTDDEMSQIKSLVKDQITLESDLDLGVIKGSDEVYNLISRLAKCNGDLAKMTAKDQAAVMTLVQFNNVTPSFGDDYNENAIELCMEDANDFIEFVDIMGTEIYVRKSSFVKAQIMEEKIVDELNRFKVQKEKKSSFMVFCGILYFALKVFILILACMYMGDSSGFGRAMFEVKDNKRITK